MADLCGHHAQKVLTQLRQPLMPTWVLLGPGGDFRIEATPFSNDLEKRLAAAYIRRRIRKYKTIAYSFVTEAWMARAPKDWDPATPMPEKDRPMHRTDRVEVVIGFATDGKEISWRRWKMIRDWNEAVVALESWPMDDLGHFESWMIDLLGK